MSRQELIVLALKSCYGSPGAALVGKDGIHIALEALVPRVHEDGPRFIIVLMHDVGLQKLTHLDLLNATIHCGIMREVPW